MPFLILAPAVLWLAAVLLAPQHPVFGALSFPLPAWLALALVGSLAALMRQGSWLYWLALLGGGYWAAGFSLGLAPNEYPVAGLQFFLPVAASSFALLLVLAPLPPPAGIGGLLLLAVSAAFLPLFSLLPLDGWYEALAAGLPVPPSLWQPPLSALPTSLLLLTALSALGAGWIALLLVHDTRAAEWGRFACWLLLAIGLQFPDRSGLLGWSMIAAALSVLLALAAQMLHLAYVDELTRLPARRALLAQLRVLGRRSALTMLDVDHFKKFNDTWGHDTGDQVLRLLGSILAQEGGFKAYRYGGEEFTLVFRHDDRARIEQALEKVRGRVASYPLKIRSPQRPKSARSGKPKRGGAAGGRQVRVTVSLGCALRREGESPLALLKRADKALYAAKKAGRNLALVKG